MTAASNLRVIFGTHSELQDPSQYPPTLIRLQCADELLLKIISLS
jgi:hypothetical protein